MKWLIKESYIERMVKALFVSNEAYQQALDAACEDAKQRKTDFVEIVINDNSDSATQQDFVIKVNWNVIEYKPTYDPTKWNIFPLVQPPKHEWMRVEYMSGEGLKAQYDGRIWALPNCHILRHSPHRFRPWED